MKVRAGFVSNSSSSSFIVIFPKEPKNAADVKNMLFKDSEVYLNPYTYDENDERSWSADSVAETVWKDICEQEKNNFEKAKSILTSGTIDDDGAPDYYDFNHITDWNQHWKAYSEAMKRYADKKMKEFFNLRKLKLQKINNQLSEDFVFYNFEYSDNDGSYFSALEHGDLFHNLKHIRVSNH